MSGIFLILNSLILLFFLRKAGHVNSQKYKSEWLF